MKKTPPDAGKGSVASRQAELWGNQSGLADCLGRGSRCPKQCFLQIIIDSPASFY